MFLCIRAPEGACKVFGFLIDLIPVGARALRLLALTTEKLPEGLAEHREAIADWLEAVAQGVEGDSWGIFPDLDPAAWRLAVDYRRTLG